MKKNINFLLITILTSLFFGISSCKKYEDGGNSFRRKQKIKDVTWNLNYRINANEYESKWETLSFENNGDFLINKILIGKYNFSNKNFIEININTDIDSINIHLIDNIQHIIIENNTFNMRLNELTNTNFSFSFTNPSNTYYYEK